MSAEVPVPASSARFTRHALLVLIVVLIADVLDLMDATITNIAAPTIVRDIGGGESLIKWLGASYALALGTLLVVGGRLGDRYGRKRLFLIGIAGFTLASLACGLAVDPTMLIVSRLVQGAFGALLIPQGMSLLISTLTREQLPTAFAIFGPTLGASAVLGPIVAGVIINANIAGLGWRPVFLINLVIGLLGFVLARRVLPADTELVDEAIDGIGAGLLGLGMLGTIFGLIEGSTDGWNALPLAAIGLGVIGFVAFAVRQRTVRNPLILPSLLNNRGFTFGLLLGLAYFAAVNGFSYVVSLYFQLQLGLSSLDASLGLAPLMVGIILASFAARPLIPKLGRTLIVIGLAVTLIGTAALYVTTRVRGEDLTALAMAPSVLVLGVGMGACFSSIFDVAIGDVSPEEAGSASGSLSSVQQLAGAIGSAIVTTLYFQQVKVHDGSQALATSVAVVGAIVVLCLGLVWLLPKKAAAEPELELA